MERANVYEAQSLSFMGVSTIHLSASRACMRSVYRRRVEWVVPMLARYEIVRKQWVYCWWIWSCVCPSTAYVGWMVVFVFHSVGNILMWCWYNQRLGVWSILCCPHFSDEFVCSNWLPRLKYVNDSSVQAFKRLNTKLIDHLCKTTFIISSSERTAEVCISVLQNLWERLPKTYELCQIEA